MAAQHLAGERAALFDYLQDAAEKKAGAIKDENLRE
jgi:hypothetical protein